MDKLSPLIRKYNTGDPWQIWIDIFNYNLNSKTSILNQFSELPFLLNLYFDHRSGGLSIIIHHAHPSPKYFISIVQSLVEMHFSDVKYNIHTGA